MDTITTQMPAATEACASCSVPIADDQRYCLNCGARRGDARVPFMDILGGGGQRSRAIAAATSPAPVVDARSQRNLTIVASIGCLLLALGVGVLIGHGGRGNNTPAAAPAQVIKVQGGGTATTAAPAASGAAAPATGKKKSADTAKTAAGSKATNGAIKKLDKLTPDQYQKQSQKLPKMVGTGGKAPPKDNKPAAGGGSFQEIG
jgi:hypothetical protein